MIKKSGQIKPNCDIFQLDQVVILDKSYWTCIILTSSHSDCHGYDYSTCQLVAKVNLATSQCGGQIVHNYQFNVVYSYSMIKSTCQNMGSVIMATCQHPLHIYTNTWRHVSSSNCVFFVATWFYAMKYAMWHVSLFHWIWVCHVSSSNEILQLHMSICGSVDFYHVSL